MGSIGTRIVFYRVAADLVEPADPIVRDRRKTDCSPSGKPQIGSKERGDEMISDICAEQTARSQGFQATALFWIRTVAGMTSAAWREHRDGRSPAPNRVALLEPVLTDLRLTIRMLLARPLFTIVIITALAIGVGGVATIFSALPVGTNVKTSMSAPR